MGSQVADKLVLPSMGDLLSLNMFNINVIVIINRSMLVIWLPGIKYGKI